MEVKDGAKNGDAPEYVLGQPAFVAARFVCPVSLLDGDPRNDSCICNASIG